MSFIEFLGSYPWVSFSATFYHVSLTFLGCYKISFVFLFLFLQSISGKECIQYFVYQRTVHIYLDISVRFFAFYLFSEMRNKEISMVLPIGCLLMKDSTCSRWFSCKKNSIQWNSRKHIVTVSVQQWHSYNLYSYHQFNIIPSFFIRMIEPNDKMKRTQHACILQINVSKCE